MVLKKIFNEIIPIIVVYQEVDSLMNNINADAVARNTPWFVRNPNRLISVTPMPAGRKDREPNVSDDITKGADSIKLVSSPKARNPMKKAKPSSKDAEIPNSKPVKNTLLWNNEFNELQHVGELSINGVKIHFFGSLEMSDRKMFIFLTAIYAIKIITPSIKVKINTSKMLWIKSKIKIKETLLKILWYFSANITDDVFEIECP